MLYARDRYLVPATIFALADYACRVWAPGSGGFIQDPGVANPWPLKCNVRIRELQVWVLTPVGRLKRGVVVSLVDLAETGHIAAAGWPLARHLALPTIPENGVIGDAGMKYSGPGFVCNYGVGWVLWTPAIVDTDQVEISVAWEGV